MNFLIGARDRPFRRAPSYMGEKGLPYGCFCECSKCGYVGRSTTSFDYFGAAGEPLRCEQCAGGVPYGTDQVMCAEIDAGRLDTDPLAEWQDGAEDCDQLAPAESGR